MAQHQALYSRSDLYDIALSRDVTPEVDFVIDVFREHRGRKPASALEIACGPGYHTHLLAERGVRAWGIDLRPEMVELAEARASAKGHDARFVAADMREFRLPEPVDIAFATFDAIDCLLTNEELVQHFRAIGANLSDEGLYIVDCTHPRDCSYQNYGDFTYEGERDGVRVKITWATNEPMVDPITGVVETEIQIEIDDHGEVEVLQDSAQERCVTPQELVLIARLSESLEPLAWYGDFDLDVPLDASERSRKMIGLFGKSD